MNYNWWLSNAENHINHHEKEARLELHVTAGLGLHLTLLLTREATRCSVLLFDVLRGSYRVMTCIRSRTECGISLLSPSTDDMTLSISIL